MRHYTEASFQKGRKVGMIDPALMSTEDMLEYDPEVGARGPRPPPEASFLGIDDDPGQKMWIDRGVAKRREAAREQRRRDR